MMEKENCPSPVFPNLTSPDIAGMGKKNLETLAAVQKEFLDALNKANQAWVAYLNEEAALNSDFTRKVTTTRSIPDATAAYQAWVSQQMELLSKQAREVLQEPRISPRLAIGSCAMERGRQALDRSPTVTGTLPFSCSC